MFSCTLLYVHFSIAIILVGKRELVALFNLSSWCLVMVGWLFLAVPMGLSAVCDCGISRSYSLTSFFWSRSANISQLGFLRQFISYYRKTSKIIRTYHSGLLFSCLLTAVILLYLRFQSKPLKIFTDRSKAIQTDRQNVYSLKSCTLHTRNNILTYMTAKVVL